MCTDKVSLQTRPGASLEPSNGDRGIELRKQQMQRIAEDRRVPQPLMQCQSHRSQQRRLYSWNMQSAPEETEGRMGLRRPTGGGGLADARMTRSAHLSILPHPTSPPEGAFLPRWVDDPLLTGETDTRMRPPSHSTMTLRQVRENVALCRSGRDEGRGPEGYFASFQLFLTCDCAE